MLTAEKTIKQHSFIVEDITELRIVAERYTAVKNYATSRYSGINSLHLLKQHRQLIRDVWIKKDLSKDFKLPARYWKLALDEAISNIKSEWSNAKNRIKEALNKNDNLTDDEKHYIRYILKSDKIYQAILQRKTFVKTEKLNSLEIREHYIHSLVCRYTRKYKGSIPYSHKKRSFMIDAPMYKYFVDNGKLRLEVAGLKKGKRVVLTLKDKNIHTGNLRVVLQDNDTLEIHRVKKIDVSKSYNKECVLAIDKGYTSLFATSTDKEYGKNLGVILTTETERLNGVNRKRNQIWAQMDSFTKNTELEKAEKIRINNFGKVKYNRRKRKFEELTKSYINHSIYKMLDCEKPTTIVCEELTFISWYKKLSKTQKRKLSRWVKGYIQERVEYIASTRQIKVEKVNPAYTSQVCHKCGIFGDRDGKVFKCKKCGNIDADINAAHNIKDRFNDKEIGKYTPYKKVKEILLSRTESLAVG